MTPLIFDLDDQAESNNALPRLEILKQINPKFRCTLFAVPGLGSEEFWNSHPDWVELAVHGHLHPDPYECANWSKERMLQAIDFKPSRFVEGWKSPGWQISDGTYEALLERGWWVADQPYNDERRPEGLRVHRLGDGDHWHGHAQNDCGNGLEETWDEVVRLVEEADAFQLISEVAR